MPNNVKLAERAQKFFAIAYTDITFQKVYLNEVACFLRKGLFERSSLLPNCTQ